MWHPGQVNLHVTSSQPYMVERLLQILFQQHFNDYFQHVGTVSEVTGGNGRSQNSIRKPQDTTGGEGRDDIKWLLCQKYNSKWATCVSFLRCSEMCHVCMHWLLLFGSHYVQASKSTENYCMLCRGNYMHGMHMPLYQHHHYTWSDLLTCKIPHRDIKSLLCCIC